MQSVVISKKWGDKAEREAHLSKTTSANAFEELKVRHVDLLGVNFDIVGGANAPHLQAIARPFHTPMQQEIFWTQEKILKFKKKKRILILGNQYFS